ncbi:uncharacterized protein VTP21DRAFT_7565 [Calcarisporiella thermophila]|uniref:uncharacterized protein n=1 Tax=Calcarisporiella thermophila TaxID=911321 RepID=UPI0037423939
MPKPGCLMGAEPPPTNGWLTRWPPTVKTQKVAAGTDAALHVIEHMSRNCTLAELAAKLVEYEWQHDPNNDPFSNVSAYGST